MLATSVYGASNTTPSCGSIGLPVVPNAGTAQEFQVISNGPVFTFELIADNNYSQLCLLSTNDDQVVGGAPTDNISLQNMVVTEIPTITGNNICCNQTINTTQWPFQPQILNQAGGKVVQTINGQPVTYQWQMDSGSGWVNIPNATTLNHNPAPINTPVKYRRLITSASLNYTSTSNEVSVIPPPITGNQICCDQVVYVNDGGNGSPITSGSVIQGNLGTISYEWQYSYDGSNWISIPNSNTASYTPTGLTKVTRYRRIVKTIMQTAGAISNTVLVDLRICDRPEDVNYNTICGDQYFYDLQNGDQVEPLLIYGSHKTDVDPDRAEFDYEWQVSYDEGASWSNIGPGRNNDQGTEGKNYDYKPDPLTYNLWWGIKEVWFKRTLYAWYDEWNCGPGNIWPCGPHWHDKGGSNFVKIFLSGFSDPATLEISGPASVNCTTSSFQLGLSGGDPSGILSDAEWEILDNSDWVVDPGAGPWGAIIRPFVSSLTGQNYATIRATLTGNDGKVVYKTYTVTSPSLPTLALNPAGQLAICQGQAINLTATAGSGQAPYSISFSAPGLNLGAVTNSGNSSSVTIPTGQYNTTEQSLLVTVVDANQCKIQQPVSVLPAGERWIHDDPWTGWQGPQLPALQNADNANIIEEGRHNIYYVGKDDNYINTLFSLQWDNAAGQWRNFAFPKGNNPVINATGPLAIYEDANHIRKIYYINQDDHNTYFIRSNGGYVNEFTTLGNWGLPVLVPGGVNAAEMITPLSDGRVIYKGLDNHLYVTTGGSLPALLESNVHGSNCVAIGNGVFYIASDGKLKQKDVNSYTDIPGAYNNISAHTLSAIAYSPTTGRLYVVGVNGEIILYHIPTATLYTYTGTQRANAAGITVNKATGVLYFSGTWWDPSATDGHLYQCYLDGATLQVRQIDQEAIQSAYGTVGVRKLFTDTNLFFLTEETGNVQMYYYFSGSCGPGITRMAFNPDNIHLNNTDNSQQETTETDLAIEPNPSTGNFTIRYSLESDGTIQLVLYNTLGEIISSIGEEFQHAGKHTMLVNEPGLADGVYFLRLSLNGKPVSIRKVVIRN